MERKTKINTNQGFGPTKQNKRDLIGFQSGYDNEEVVEHYGVDENGISSYVTNDNLMNSMYDNYDSSKEIVEHDLSNKYKRMCSLSDEQHKYCAKAILKDRYSEFHDNYISNNSLKNWRDIEKRFSIRVKINRTNSKFSINDWDIDEIGSYIEQFDYDDKYILFYSKITSYSNYGAYYVLDIDVHLNDLDYLEDIWAGRLIYRIHDDILITFFDLNKSILEYEKDSYSWKSNSEGIETNNFITMLRLYEYQLNDGYDLIRDYNEDGTINLMDINEIEDRIKEEEEIYHSRLVQELDSLNYEKGISKYWNMYFDILSTKDILTIKISASKK